MLALLVGAAPSLLGAHLMLIRALAPAQGASDPAQRGLEIARAADRANEGFGGEKATLTMELLNAYGDVSRRKLTIESLEVKDDGDRSKITFEAPADVKGHQAAHLDAPPARGRPVALPAGDQARQTDQRRQPDRLVHGQRVRLRGPARLAPQDFDSARLED